MNLEKCTEICDAVADMEKAGRPVLLTDEEMGDVQHRYKFYGTSRLPR